MAEYIEREAALEAVCKYCCEYDAERTECICNERLAVLKIPTADVAPVRHGRWEKQSGLYSCSECGMTCPYDVQADVIEYWACNYCPNCGAKMDLENQV